jgi:Rap1a immunity proteins
MKIKVVVAMMAMVLFSVGTRGATDFTNAKEMHDYCKLFDRYDQSDQTAALSSLDSMNIGQCLGFMSGWLQGVNGLVTVMDDKSYVVSFADGVTVGQMSRVFVLYVEKHPEYDNKPGDFVLSRAMIDAKLLILTLQKSAVSAMVQ